MITEKEIENNLISKLKDLKYTHKADIHDKNALEANFREKFQWLNKVNLTDSEFTRLKGRIISNDVFECAQLLRNRNSMERDDGTPLHYTLVNIKNWCKNSFEVINQLRINTDNSHHRYDVILLINGIPVVQIELKTLSVSPRRAMQQIVEYKNDIGNGYTNSLLCFMQLFIVSNSNETWYFANNDKKHFAFDAEERFLPLYQFADEKNEKITHLDAFAEKFLAKCTLGEIISRYMVLVACEQKLIMMRPYQIYAVRAIVDCIEQNRGDGYIWHTTGSGKTLTSFKASTLLKDNPSIDKCLFVVDRKDLDLQTREEFNKFQEGCVEENTNTETLVKRLLSDDYSNKVIVTTIQKLGLALDDTGKNDYKKRLGSLSEKKVVFIFDECHRSQFGKNHKAIKEFFKNAQLFGFTGTPIFAQNSTYQHINGQESYQTTTESIFEKKLHAYTITHAIEDRNVLRFHIDYFKREECSKPTTDILSIKKAVVRAILEKHNAATSNRRFNAIFATASIDDAIEYYSLFKELQDQQIQDDINYQPLNIACVFSPPPEGNQDIKQIQEDLPQEKEDNNVDPNNKKDKLKIIIDDYNKKYKMNHDINNFDRYYQDVQKRIKDQQYTNKDYAHENKIDIVIVVDMLLTGFDSKYLNTLYVDKNLNYHGLIQAFSRTNRILNDTKPYGNILDFRNQQKEVDIAIGLFSGEQSNKAKEIWLVEPASAVIDKLETSVLNLKNFMQSQKLTYAPKDVANLKGDEARSIFINMFKEVQRLKTQLDQYTDLTNEDDKTIEKIISHEQLQAFRGVYLETAQRLKNIKEGNKELVKGVDFEFVLFASVLIDYDYIIGLISRYTGKQTNMTMEQIIGIINADSKFIDEREDITAYIQTLNTNTALKEHEIRNGYATFRKNKLTNNIKVIAEQYGLQYANLQTFIDTIIRRMIFDGEQLTELLEPLRLNWKTRREKELALMKDLATLLNRLSQGKKISGLNAYEE